MKKRYLAITLGLVVSTALTMTACGSSSTSTAASTTAATETQTTETAEESTIYGEVVSVEDNVLTINVGTMEEGSTELTLSGETQEITLTDETVIARGGMAGGSGQAPDAAASGDSTGDTSDSSSDSTEDASESTSDSSSDSTEDASDSSSDTTEATSDSSTPPEIPSDNGQGGQVPDGNAPGDSGQAPDGSAPSGDGQAPDGSAPSGDGQAPDGSAPSDNGQAPDAAASGDSTEDTSDSSTESTSGSSDQSGMADTELTTDDLTEGTTVSVTLGSDGSAATITILGGDMGGGMGAPGGGSSSADVTYSSENEISEDTTLSDTEIDSTGTDEEAILVDNGATATLSNLTITRTSSDSTGGDNSSFYGVGASVLTTDGTTYLSDSTITSDAKGGAGVFSYSENATTYVADTTITTEQDTSGGIHVAGGGTLYAWDVTAETNGESSAAIRSDRGSGTMVVDGGTYTSNGTGSPAVYSTADITINDATLTATGSEAACIEGDNTIRLFDCDLSGDMPENEQNDCTWNVILYQSMSGDSEVGNSTFEMIGGSLTANAGGMFYTTNTQSSFILDDVDLTYSDTNDFFLKATGNSNARGWGSSGANGANCTFTAIDQDMEGDVIWDSISTVDFYMTGSSTLKGAVTDDESNAGDGGDGYCNLYISSDSTWTVTGDSTLTNLYNEGTIVDEDGNTVSIVGTDGTTYVEGTSQYTITVDSYSTTADFSGAGEAESFSTYEVSEPEELD